MRRRPLSFTLAAAALALSACGGSDAPTGTVTPAPAPPPAASAVASVVVTTALDTLEAYDVVPLRATVRDAQGNALTDRAVRWTSSDPAVATVDATTGVLTGVDRGTVTVTATSEGKSGTASRVVVIRYRSITAGSMHACDIASGGIVWCWGLNGREGRLGGSTLGETVQSSAPVRLPGEQRYAQISSYGATTCGVTREADAYCWGANGWGLLGNGSTAAFSATPVLVSGGLKLRQVSVGSDFVCALTTAGRLHCWGDNGDDNFGTTTPRYSTTPVPGAQGMTFASLTAGSDYACGVTDAGAGFCWGFSGLGNLGDGARPTMGNTTIATPNAVVGGHAFRSLSASSYVTCGVTTAGQGLCWGRGTSNRLGTGSTGESSVPGAVLGGHAFRSIAVGFGATCGIATDATLWCWGSGELGQLGQVVPNTAAQPVQVGGGVTASEVSPANVAGGFGTFTCAVAADRLTTWCWGRNDVGQLGNGTTTAATATNATPSIVVGQKPLP